MANLQIKNLPDDVHDELRRRASAESTTIRDYVLRLLELDQAFPPRHRWVDAVLALPPITVTRSAADLVAADRAERDAELAGRLADR
jgi:plasmid stability protein